MICTAPTVTVTVIVPVLVTGSIQRVLMLIRVGL